MTDRALELRGVTAGYRGIPTVRDLDLFVDRGEVVALIGANGAGKTTTLLAVSGLVERVAGEIEVGGRSTARLGPARIARLGVAHVPEDRSLFLRLTVRENLRLAGNGRGRGQVSRAVELFPALAGLLDRRAGLLSGGEQQMLALARALVGEPRLLLVDEMSLGLAPVVVERLFPVVRSVAEETGAGVLLVEQHVELALGVADRAYVLSHGALAAEGSASVLAGRHDLLASAYFGA